MAHFQGQSDVRGGPRKWMPCPMARSQGQPRLLDWPAKTKASPTARFQGQPQLLHRPTKRRPPRPPSSQDRPDFRAGPQNGALFHRPLPRTVPIAALAHKTQAPPTAKIPGQPRALRWPTKRSRLPPPSSQDSPDCRAGQQNGVKVSRAGTLSVQQ